MSTEARPSPNTPSAIPSNWTQSAALVAGLLVLWTLTHRFFGLSHDGELYALQAVARIHPYFEKDILLQGTSQDSFTVFSPLFGMLIKNLGLINASTLLFAFCAAAFLVAAWLLMRRFFDPVAAYFAAALTICTSNEYGSYQVFHSTEDFLTARSLAEACVIASIAAYYWRKPWMAAALAILGMLVHPLMALPGLLLLACLILPLRFSLAAAIAGLIAVILISAAAMHGLINVASFRPMDPAWFEVVEERSLFLFLKDWRLIDWEAQLRPCLSLLMATLIIQEPRIRRLSISAVLVGACGLVLAGIPDFVGPIPILLQGQAWRWVWILDVLAVCLVAPTAILAWRADPWGPLFAVLLVMGWIFVPVDSLFCFVGAFIVWLVRARAAGSERAFRWGAYGLLGIVAAWTLANLWQLIDSRILLSKEPLTVAAFLRGLGSMAPLSLTGLWFLGRFIRREPKRSVFALVLLCGLSACLLPTSLLDVPGFDAIRHREQYKDWRDAIPESAMVLVLPSPLTAVFPWFTLERVSYLSVSQSSGVVFSAKTAAEIRRRSEVVLPVMPQDWRILSQIRNPPPKKGADALTEPTITRQSLEAICKDSLLGFVIAKEDVGFSPIRHTGNGIHKNWNLYDCRRVRGTQLDKS